MRLNLLITVASIVTISILYFTSYLNTFSSIIARNIKPFGNHYYRIGLPNEITADSFFLYRAYIYDKLVFIPFFLLFLINNAFFNRSNITSIRILSINQCIEPARILRGIVNEDEVRLRARAIEGSCPWRWAPGCRYNSYVFDAMSTNSTHLGNHIALFKDNGMVRLPLRRVPSRAIGTLNVCVPPIYWFSDWIKIIFFLETWRAQGARHVFLYYHSSTDNVRKVLNDYEKEGFVTIIPWPLLPKNHVVDPNKSLYRLAHSLAHNDCMLRIGSEFGALVDIDELIIPRNGSLLSLVTERFADPSVGELSFTHQSLQLRPSLAGAEFEFKSLDFSGIFNATQFDLPGPPKVPLVEAVLLHHRYNHMGGKNPIPVRLVPDNSTTYILQKTMITRARKIFPHGADFHRKTQTVVGGCLKSWRESGNHCKTPISSCRNDLINLERWHFTETTEGFLPL